MQPLAVIVATLDRPGALADTVADVLAQLRAGDTLTVVDQSETPYAPGPGADPRLTVIPRVERALPAARNAGLAATTAPIALFLDDDVRLHPGCLDAHRAAYADPTVGGVAGRILERVLRPNAARTCNRVDRGGRIRTRLDGTDPVDVDTAKGANMSFRRQALDEAGPFDPGYGGNALLEDADLSTRVRAAGWRIRFVPGACIDHLHLPSGGVRADAGRIDAGVHRFRNTAYFVRRHRGWAGLPPVAATYAAIAVADAGRAGDLRRVLTLARAFARGWVDGRPTG